MAVRRGDKPVRIPRIRCTFALAAAILLLPGFSWAQTVVAEPTPTPLPYGTPANADCRTGAQGRPSVWGVSGGNFNSIDATSCCTGTMGAMVQDSAGNDYVLSNNHVLARTSSTGSKAQVGEPIVQPGLVDTGCWQDAGDAVGHLSQWVPLNFASKSVNTVDVAIAKLQTGMMDPTGWILNIGTISATPFAFSQVVVGLPVQKNGRTSCQTTGLVDATDAKGKVLYAKGCGARASGVATFDHQILIYGVDQNLNPATFSAPGDSGSLVVTQETCPRAVGLLFAGAGDNLTVINPIEQVLGALNVSLIGQCVNTGSSQAPVAQLANLGVAASAALLRSMNKVRAVKEMHADALLAIKDVTAVGIGRSDSSDQADLVVYVTKDTRAVRASIPSHIDGVTVRIEQSGQFHAL